MELAVDIAADGDRRADWLHIGLLGQNFLGLESKKFRGKSKKLK